MQVTNVQIKLHRSRTDKLRAYATVTFDGCFVVRDIRLVDGPEGLFIAMPSRKITGPCPGCGSKNALQASFCNECGARLTPRVADGKIKLHSDLAHPLNPEMRTAMQDAVIKAYHEAEARGAAFPGSGGMTDAGPEEFGA
jgi:stage V sporulation protein G